MFWLRLRKEKCGFNVSIVASKKKTPLQSDIVASTSPIPKSLLQSSLNKPEKRKISLLQSSHIIQTQLNSSHLHFTEKAISSEVDSLRLSHFLLQSHIRWYAPSYIDPSNPSKTLSKLGRTLRFHNGN